MASSAAGRPASRAAVAFSLIRTAGLVRRLSRQTGRWTLPLARRAQRPLGALQAFPTAEGFRQQRHRSSLASRSRAVLASSRGAARCAPRSRRRWHCRALPARAAVPCLRRAPRTPRAPLSRSLFDRCTSSSGSARLAGRVLGPPTYPEPIHTLEGGLAAGPRGSCASSKRSVTSSMRAVQPIERAPSSSRRTTGRTARPTPAGPDHPLVASSRCGRHLLAGEAAPAQLRRSEARGPPSRPILGSTMADIDLKLRAARRTARGRRARRGLASCGSSPTGRVGRGAEAGVRRTGLAPPGGGALRQGGDSYTGAEVAEGVGNSIPSSSKAPAGPGGGRSRRTMSASYADTDIEARRGRSCYSMRVAEQACWRPPPDRHLDGQLRGCQRRLVGEVFTEPGVDERELAMRLRGGRSDDGAASARRSCMRSHHTCGSGSARP